MAVALTRAGNADSRTTCANCVVYSWKCDMSKPKTCGNCKAISYCSNICQLEHWNKTHKKHCKYLSGDKVKEKATHTHKNCMRCKLKKRGKPNEFRDPESEVLPCIFCVDNFVFHKNNKKSNQKQTLHPGSTHAFLPIEIGELSGKWVCPQEQCISVITHILAKLQFTDPDVEKKVESLFSPLMSLRLKMWNYSLVTLSQYRQQRHAKEAFQLASNNDFTKELEKLSTEYKGRDVTGKWWKALRLFTRITECLMEGIIRNQELEALVQPVLDAALVKMPPYSELIKALSGGSDTNICKRCGEDVTVLDILCGGPPDPTAELLGLNEGRAIISTRGFLATCKRCHEYLAKDHSVEEEKSVRRQEAAAFGIFCHNCGIPCRGRPRCKGCQSKSYCSEECQTEDLVVHELFCTKIQDAASAGELGRRVSKKLGDKEEEELIGRFNHQRLMTPEEKAEHIKKLKASYQRGSNEAWEKWDTSSFK